ncbi:unnamed protein product, partial [Meganyctiphanes norvegica]
SFIWLASPITFCLLRTTMRSTGPGFVLLLAASLSNLKWCSGMFIQESNAKTWMQQEIQKCGEELVDMLVYVCEGRYNQPMNVNINKRLGISKQVKPSWLEFRPFESFDKSQQRWLPYFTPDLNYPTDNYKPDILPANPSLKKRFLLPPKVNHQKNNPSLSEKELLLSPHQKRGLSSECCRKSCQLSHLLLYCQ